MDVADPLVLEHVSTIEDRKGSHDDGVAPGNGKACVVVSTCTASRTEKSDVPKGYPTWASRKAQMRAMVAAPTATPVTPQIMSSLQQRLLTVALAR